MIIKVTVSDVLEEEVTAVRSIFITENTISCMTNEDGFRNFPIWAKIEVVKR